MAIIVSYFSGEHYGVLGPQMAATIIQENTPFECIVIAVTREDDKQVLKKNMEDYFKGERPLLGFSSLSGRKDLFDLAKELKEEGAVTILAGPQADVDYMGEKARLEHPHRFQGLSDHFTFALHGPGEQIIPFLMDFPGGEVGGELSGMVLIRDDGRVVLYPKKPWEGRFLRSVRWDNLYRTGPEGLSPISVRMGQVLQHIGCPHAGRSTGVEIDYPAYLPSQGKKVKLEIQGCSFCDVAIDKGFHGSLDRESVLLQINGLPSTEDGRKIPFELINENALPGLPLLLKEAAAQGDSLSQVNLTLRADYFLKGEQYLRESLILAREMGFRILCSSVGFETFDERILKNLHKGIDVETNLQAIYLMRRMKEEFPSEWAYARDEGAIHGFIHPTPWDTRESMDTIQRIIHLNHLERDVLPPHSTPLIIHHASFLGDWIREVETHDGIQFHRDASIIGWWQIGDRFIL